MLDCINWVHEIDNFNLVYDSVKTLYGYNFYCRQINFYSSI